MPKISIYLPDAMYDELRRRDLPLSALAQRAFADAIAADANAAWIARVAARPLRTPSMSTEELMAEVDAEFGA